MEYFLAAIGLLVFAGTVYLAIKRRQDKHEAGEYPADFETPDDRIDIDERL